ncbi:hypothetical protein ACFQO7_22060 [Catellatospora aurea]|uniref:Secreted protein n=1 Tax=Catellatospora aurea TaxID=1337874 RepID=A0ABW2H1S7_9ACTN
MTLVLALAGLVTTLLGALGAPWVQARVAARREHAARMRDRRMNLYERAFELSDQYEEWIHWLCQPPWYMSRPTVAGDDELQKLTARMRLAAAKDVWAAWSQFREAALSLDLALQHDPAYEDLDEHNEGLSASDPYIAAVQVAIVDLRTAVMQDVSSAG